VTLALDKRYKFPKDTTASINTSGLLGESYVGLDAGGDDKPLEAGDRISITQSAVVLEKLIGQFLFSKAQDEPATANGAAAAPAKLPEPPGSAGAKKK
jgi:phospholipid/cholesterol/gamma-HCH transport system substrate-binding protein